MKLKHILVVALCLVLVSALSIIGTVAYLTDTDVKLNVMTLGEVKIEQLEYERVVDDNGNWIQWGTEKDKYGCYPEELKPFSQAKPLLPAVFADGVIKWDDRAVGSVTTASGKHQQSWAQIGAPGSQQLFDDSVKNAIDKFVFVKNTGKTDAYVRTVIAFELGDVAYENFGDVIMTNSNSGDADSSFHWLKEWVTEAVEINGNNYAVCVYTYRGAEDSGYNGILAAGDTSYASLLQVYMKPGANNDDVKAIDGNGNGAYDILVLSQAVQVDGFDNAALALTAGFGDVTSNNIKAWFEDDTNAIEIPNVVSNGSELAEALTGGKDVILADDVAIDEQVSLNGGVLNGNGNTITSTVPRDASDYTVPAVLATEGTVENLTVIGDGRGVGTRGALTGDLTVNNYKADGGSYALHVGSGNGYKLTVTNSELYGWTSYGTGFSAVTFTNCKFGLATTGSNYVRAYSSTVFTNCEFAGTELDLADGLITAGGTVTLVNCTYNGTLITESNVSSLVTDAGDLANVVIG